MSRWTIYNRRGEALHESIEKFDGNGKIVEQDTLEYSGKWMGDCFVTVSFKSAYPIDFQIGDYIDYRGERFVINYDPTVVKKSSRGTYGEGFTYDSVKFNALSNELTDAKFHDWVLSDNKIHYSSLPSFSFYAKDMNDLADRLQACTNRWCKDNGFAKEDYWIFYTPGSNGDTNPYDRAIQRAKDISTDSTFIQNVLTRWKQIYGEDGALVARDDERLDRSISVSNQTVWQGMSLFKNQFGLNFIIRGREVIVGAAGVIASHIFMYGKGNGLYEIDKHADTDQKVVTRLHAYGSSDNLPARYYAELDMKVSAAVTDVDKEKDYMYLTLDMLFKPSMFTQKLSKYGDNIYAIRLMLDGTEINARVEGSDGNGKVRIYSEYLDVSENPDDNTDKDIYDAFYNSVKAGSKVYITGGVNKDLAPAGSIDYSMNALPNNMAVMNLMLPGFPKYALSDICKSEYDTNTDTTSYYIRKSKDSSEWVKFHSERGKHVVRFSSDQYDPYIVSQNAETLGYKDDDIFCTEENDDNGLKKVYPSVEEITEAEAGVSSSNDYINTIVSADVIKDNGVFSSKTGTTIPGFQVTVKDLGFNLHDAIAAAGGDGCRLSMKDGNCGGRDFEVPSVSKNKDGSWTLNCRRSQDSSLDLYYPYSYNASIGQAPTAGEAYQICAGDHYVLTGIALEATNYVWAASVKLLRKAIHWLCKNDYSRYVYTPKIDEIYMARQDEEAKASGGKEKSLHDTLKEGDLLWFKDDDLMLDGKVYIDQLTIKENGNNGIPTYDVALRNETQVGTIQRIQNKVDSIANDISSGNVGGGMSPSNVENIVNAIGESKFLRKDQDDETEHTLTVGALKTKTFDGDGFLGHGARIDKEGNLVAKSIYAREFMSAPKFVFNEISVTNAEQWSTNAYGTILSVDKDKRLITLKLEENEYGSVNVGDICRGMYADIGNEYGSDSNAEGSADECGFTVHRGFFTTYFCVTEIVTNERGNCVFRYKKRVPSGPDPCKFMDFAQYGSFTDTSRQSSMFMSSRGHSYHMILAGVNDWVIRPQMRVACYGCLDGITVLMKDGSEQELKGYGVYVQKNVYFGGAVMQLKDISDLDDLQKMAGSYDVQLSNYAGVITVDDLGNVIGGLYTTNSNGDKQYRLATTTYVRKGDEILTYEPDDTLDEPTEGHYRLQVISEDCTVEVHNSTAYVTAIRNLRDGVSGTDETIDYDKMHKMNACRVTLIVELEGKTVKSIEFPIRIAHDQLPFMLCDLTNEHDSVSWNTKERKYIGFPVETGISMLYHNDPYDIDTVEVTNLPSGLKAAVTDNGKRKNVTFTLDGTKGGDFLLQTQDINIHVTSTYAGAVYEYDKVFTLDKKSDAVIWDIIPTSDCIVANKLGVLSATSLGVDIYGTSTDDKRFNVEFADLTKYSLTLWYKKASDATEKQITTDTTIPVAKGDMSVTFILKNGNGGVEDKEDVPVVAWGEDGKGVEFIYKRTENGATLSPSDNPTPSDWESSTSAYQTNTEYVSNIGNGWTDNPQGADSTHNIEYVCVRKSVNGVWGRFSDPAPFATFTTGVKSINTFYGVFDNGVSPSSGDGFTYDTIDAAVISANAGKYVWSADFVTYSDGKTEWKDFVLVGKCDDIATVEEQYAVTDSPTDIPTENSNWSSSLSGIMSQITNGKALWSCDFVTYRNNSGTKHINIQFVGSAGKNGNSIIVKGSLVSVNNLPTSGATTGDSYVINGLLYVYTGAQDSVGADNDYDDVGDSYRGFTNVGKLQGDAGKSNYIHVAWCNTNDNSDGSFTKSNPDGKAYAFFGTKVDETASDESLAFSDYSWQCVKGESVTITGTEVNYQISDSGTTHPETWEENIVTATDEKPFLWTKTIVNFSGKTDPLVSYSVSYKGKDGKGVNIKSKEVKYTVTADSTQPSDSDFTYDSIDAAGVTVGKYVWCMTVITYDDASSTVVKSYSVTRIGADGKGVDRIESAYAVIDAGKAPDSNTVFGSDVDSLLSSSNSGKSIWSADRIFYVDGSASLGNYAFVGNVDDIAKTRPVYGYSANVSTEPSAWVYDGKEAASNATSSGYALWSGDEVYWKKEGKYEVINKQCIGAVGKKGDQGMDGSDGDTTCDLFISSITQPDAPTVSSVSNYKNGTNLGGWSKTQPSLSADAGVPITMENQSGNSHNWIQVGAGKFMSPSSQGNSETSIIKVSFYANTNTSATFNMFSSSEANYDYCYCSSLDSSNSGYENAYEKVSGESVSKDVTFSVSAGSHYVYFGYRKDGSGSKGDDRVTVSLVTSRIWKSSRVANGSSFSGSWSTPTIVASASLPGAPGEGGEKGSRGPMPATYDSINANTWYYSGADGEKEQSFVYSQGAGKWYECISTFYANSTLDPKDDSTHFALANNFENIATKVLLARRAKIDNLYVDDVSIVDDKKNVLAKMNKGGITCNTGTFNDVTVNGTINSTNGSIGGMKLAKYTMQSSRIDEGDWNADYSQCSFDNGMAIGTKGFVIGDIWSAVSMGKLACSFGIKYVDGESTLLNYRYIHGTIPSNTHQIHDIALLIQYRQQTSPAVVYSSGYGALTVDSNGVGIESLSQNAFGGMALGTIVSSSLTSSETDAINKNRVSYLVMTNTAETTISLPSQPMAGQRFTVIQGNSGNIKFNSNKTIQTGGKVYYSSGSTRPHSGTTGQWNEFLFDGTVWRASYHQGTL